jgi:ABC-type antimicrobial peptide transport system permease subunit
VLAAVAAIVGIGLIAVGLAQLDAALLQLIGRLPFWMAFRLSSEGVIYVVALTFLAGAIVGVVPALKATGGRVQSRLQGLSAGSGSRMQMGRLWTLLIVAQVAFAVALLPATLYHAWTSLKFRTGAPGYAAQELLTTQLALDRTAAMGEGAAGDRSFRALYTVRRAELERRLEAEPGVTHVTFSLVNPGNELAAVLEIEGLPLPIDPANYNIVEGTKLGHLVRFNRVALDFFDALEVPVLAGRGLQPGDMEADQIIVNRTLATRLFGAESALGHRIRYVGRSREAPAGHLVLGRWYVIVGIVPDFPAYGTLEEGAAMLYHPVEATQLYPAILSVRVRGSNPASFAGRLREVSAAVDPNLQLRNVSTTEEAVRREQGLVRLIGMTLVVVMGSVIVLSAAGIYALMSFTVARRRKEIGIRAALGAEPSRILWSIFSRALVQLAVGAALGLLGAVGLEQVLEGEMFQGHGAVILPAVAVLMTVVGLLAAVGPARRGLRIQPTEALRAE